MKKIFPLCVVASLALNAALAYYAFIKDSVKNQKPYDQLARDVITGIGDSYATGNADYVVRQLQNNGPAQDTYDNLVAHSGETAT